MSDEQKPAQVEPLDSARDKLPPSGGSRDTKRATLWLWLPLAVFAGFFVLVMFGLLRPADREVASAFIGKPLPAFDLRPAEIGRAHV